ncbi:chromosome partitioning protein ParA [Mycobacterium sp. 852013-51886_SCH5428379]|uniref:MinD/ParA family ATP-binding protein n=1 Tax=Mycobacterium sp. 852013-51886_SCH5428379 TaxID=1834111 RepID=UPI0007FE3133|nr:MinD/ParA family protein [Mycobacterium sp. 852013-51886_SCH5428379]OBB60149.1 chromosome partitioning protein ParA [Mycobacterium sp. 852013-51886_SCH5428379]
MVDQPADFRSQQRFSDPAAADPLAAPEWTAPTPPTGFPAVIPPVPPAQAAVPPPAPRPAASRGWRRWLHLGDSSKALHREQLAARIAQPLTGCYRIAVVSLKGGVGKTTVTATLGATLAAARSDRVVAVDANPNRGTLSQRVPVETPATVRHLLRDAEGIDSYSAVRGYTSQDPSGLEVLASESDPAVSEAFSADDFQQTLSVLRRFYSVVVTDCGTGLMHSAMSAVLDSADLLIIVSTGSVDASRSAAATLDWLDAHGRHALVADAVAVVNAVRPRSGKVDLQKVQDHFSRRCRAVQVLPFDPHLDEGGEIDLQRLKPATRDALMELAAVVADGFARSAPEGGARTAYSGDARE